jgi:hypothetical protein
MIWNVCVLGFLLSLLPTLHSGVSICLSCFFLCPLLWDKSRNVSFAFLSRDNAYGFLTHFVSLAYVCYLLVHRKRIHSAPLLHFPSPIEPSWHRSDINAEVPVDKANTSSHSYAVTETNNTPEIDVSITVSRRDF